MTNNLKIFNFLKFSNITINFFAKNNIFCSRKFLIVDKKKKLFIFYKYINNKLIIFLKIKKIINFYKLYNMHTYFLMQSGELELKGLNYRFSKFWSNVLLDLGQSHFQLFFYPLKHVLVFLWKKKLKRVLIVGFNNQIFSSLISFFWYNLKSVGPYKLKGFQFINERLKLKQGKKPFK